MRSKFQRETDFLEAMENTRKYFDGATSDDPRYMALYDFIDTFGAPRTGDGDDWIETLGQVEDRVKQRMMEIADYTGCREQVLSLIEGMSQALFEQDFITVMGDGKFKRIGHVLSGIIKEIDTMGHVVPTWST